MASDRHELVSNHERKSNSNPNPVPDPNANPDPNHNPEHNPNLTLTILWQIIPIWHYPFFQAYFQITDLTL